MKMILTKANAKLIERETLTKGMRNAVKVSFVFSADWDGLTKLAVFTAGDVTKPIILDETNECFVPEEVCYIAGVAVNCGVYGMKDGITVIPSINVRLDYVRDGADPEGDAETKTPGIWEQAIGKIEEAKRIARDVKDRADAGDFDGKKGDPFRYEDFTDENKKDLLKDVYLAEQIDRMNVCFEVDLTKCLTITSGSPIEITKDTIKTSENINGIIDVKGYFKIEVENEGIDYVTLTINGTDYSAIGYEGQKTKISFKGEVNEPIEIYVENGARAKFTKFLATAQHKVGEIENNYYTAEKVGAMVLRDVDLTKYTTITYGEAEVSNNRIISVSMPDGEIHGDALIDVRGYVELEFSTLYNSPLYINGIFYGNDNTTFKGVITEPISVWFFSNEVITFNKFVVDINHKLENEYYTAEEVEKMVLKPVDLTKVATSTKPMIITSNNISRTPETTGIVDALIDIKGYVEIEAGCDEDSTSSDGSSLIIDGQRFYTRNGVSFKGVVNEPIRCRVSSICSNGVTFTRFVTTSDYELHNKVDNELSQIKEDQASRANIKNGTGEYSLQQTPKIESWYPENAYVLDYIHNPTYAERPLYWNLDENGNPYIITGAFASYSALLSGYGQITGEQSTARGRRIIVLGEMSHGEGTEVFVLGKYAHGEGNNVTVLGSGGHGEGMDTYVEKEFGHAEGKGTQAIGVSAHAQNYQTIAKGAHSHAQNARTQANGECSTSMGIDTIADGYASFAGGNGSKAKANNAFALNGKTLAQGENSTAMGDSTQALGRASIASGHKTITRDNAQGSRAGGAFTIAGSQYQDVRGMFNVEDTENKFADIVGGGTGETARKNIYTLDWSGNGYFAGDVTFTYKGTTYKASDLLSRLEALEKKLGG